MTFEFSEINEAKPSAISENKAAEAFQKEAFNFGAIPERHNNHGGAYPNPAPEFHKPESKLSVSPPGKIVPTIELMEPMAKPIIKTESMVNGRYPEQDAAIRHHHSHGNPYPLPRFNPPESSISVSPPGKVRH
jgi:hypothetical protein